jgi:flagellar biosynthesis protein FlhF
MKIKTFYAKTMAEALQEIKDSLGDDALLLSTREIPNRSGLGGQASGFEVVAAIDSNDEYGSRESGEGSRDPRRVDSISFSRRAMAPEQGIRQDSVRASSTGIRPIPAQKGAKAQREVTVETGRRTPPVQGGKSGTEPGASKEVCRPVKAMPAASPAEPVAASGSIAAAPGNSDFAAADHPKGQYPDDLSGEMSKVIYQDLVSSGVDEWLARKLLIDAMELAAPKPKQSRGELLRAAGQAAGSLMMRSSSSDGTPKKKIVAFVGPTGVGKTTAIVKLAAQLALRQRRKVILMTLDGYRIGAVEQLKSYAGLLGIPFRFIGQVQDLPKAVEDQNQKDFVLIDTAGRSPRDLGAMKDVAQFLQSSAQIEKHLVLSATTKQSDLHDIVDRFEVCRPDYLLFTKLDETWTLGPILNELVRTHKPMSYYSDGQRVPEDLHIAPPEQIVDIVLSGRYLW